jgi:hypothetical protein
MQAPFIIGISKPGNHFSGSLEDGSHLYNLFAAFLQIVLVDTYSIDPYWP